MPRGLAHSKDAIRYGFAVGRVRVLETRLLGRGTYERLLDAPTFADQKRVLSETHFGRYLEHAETASDVESGIDASLADLFEEFLERAELPDPVVRFFRVPFDYSNLKSVLKSRLLAVEEAPSLTSLGTVPADAFAAPGDLPGALGEFAREALAREDYDAEELDGDVDQAMYAAVLELARASGIAFLVELQRRVIDVANVKVLMRTCVARRGPDVAAGMLVAGGTFDAAQLVPSVRKTPGELAADIIATGVVRADAAALVDMTRLDVVLDEAVAVLTHEARMVALGPEPVLAYVLARQEEAMSLCHLLVGKLVGLDRDTVRMRLREAI